MAREELLRLRVKERVRGAWSNTCADYLYLDLVQSGPKLYLCKGNGLDASGTPLPVPSGTPCSNTTYWIEYAELPAGPQGIQGLKGIQGEVGPQGIQGDQGPQGIQGLKGIQGEVGPQGIQGDQGPQGIQGLKGDKGDKGDTGPSGPQGIQGIQGIQGEVGPQGIQGEKGDKGDTGLQGPQGLKGDTGPQGTTGLTGATGPKGEKGDTPSINNIQPDENGNILIDATVIPMDASVIGGKTISDSLSQNTTHYGVRWDKINAQMVRTGNAAGITTNTANFKHSGSKNVAKSNPFDSIYPWSGRKLCNINIDRYFALAAGDDLLSCVKAWEGDVDFSYTDTDGVWVYTPDFWGKSWDADGYRHFDITDAPIGSYIHYKEGISGRWHGGIYTRTVDGAEKTVLLPKPGMPGKLTPMSTLHTYAKNYGATLDNIFSIDASTLLYLVEYGNYNTQNTIGNGVSSLYRQSSDLLQSDVADSATVKVLAASADAVIVNAIMDIGATNGSASIGSYIVSAVETDPGDATLEIITLTTDGVTPASITATTASFWSIHGLANVADEDIGSDTGYIGVNGRSNVYYRGETFAANLWYYILGVYRETGTGHVWIAHDEDEADAYDALNADVHMDTGIVLPQGDGGAVREGYINELAILGASGLLCTPPICIAVGGNSSNPVGDYCYVPALTAGNTILVLGGPASSGPYAGRFCGYWGYTAGNSNWHSAARPRLKRP